MKAWKTVTRVEGLTRGRRPILDIRELIRHLSHQDGVATLEIRKKWPEAVCEVLEETKLRVVGVPPGAAATNRLLVEPGHQVSALVPRCSCWRPCWGC